jgi:flagellar basal body rod protein FlgC
MVSADAFTLIQYAVMFCLTLFFSVIAIDKKTTGANLLTSLLWCVFAIDNIIITYTIIGSTLTLIFGLVCFIFMGGFIMAMFEAYTDSKKEKLGCKKSALFNKLQAANISKHRLHKPNKKKLPSDETIKHHYIVEELSYTEIAEKYGITDPNPVRLKLARMKLITPISRKGIRMERVSHRYNLIYLPNHPRANPRGYVWEHIVIAEKKIGRPITNKECVHHIDWNKTNNAPENLEVCNRKDHRRYHDKIGKLIHDLIHSGTVGFSNKKGYYLIEQKQMENP